MSQPWLKKESERVPQGDRRGKIRQVVKQHSSAGLLSP